MLDLLAVQWDASVLRSWMDFFLPWWESFSEEFVGEDLLIQLACLVGVWVLAYGLTLGLRPLIRKMVERSEGDEGWTNQAIRWLSENLFRLILVVLLWAVSIYFDTYNIERAARIESTLEVIQSSQSVELQQSPAMPEVPVKNYILLRAVASVATLWWLSGALPKAIKSQPYFRMLFFVIAVVLMLNLLGLWGAVRDGLNQMKLLPISDSGETQVTAFTLVKGLLVILIVIPLSRWLMRVGHTRIQSTDTISPALQAIAIKFLNIIIIVGSGLFAISAMGINLSAFAIFGGAVGLGLGFGFQKVVSNLLSGVILLGDRSIKPGDVVEVDDTYGWINKLGARYVSVITRNGTEHLIPNETLITEKVVNWSFSDDNVRIKAPFGVSYSSDIHIAMDLALRAAKEHPRVLAVPPPVVRLMGFGDNSVDFELRFWIQDPAKGVNNAKSELYVKIWDLFHENGIEFPFPQRDLHLKEVPPLEVRVLREEGEREL